MPKGSSQPTATSTASTEESDETATPSSASYYLRVDIDGTAQDSPDDNSQLVGTPDDELVVTFVDLYTRLRTEYSPGDAQIEDLTSSVQDCLHLCSRTDLVVFRWPWLVGPDEESHIEEIDAWIGRLTGSLGGAPVLGPRIRIGVIQHQVSKQPTLRWGRWSPQGPEIVGVIDRLRSVETEALLRRRRAIWEPKSYHYRVPSGEHSDVFIRVADAINEPQDAYVMACWLSERLREVTGVVVDTGGLTPLILQLEGVLTRFGWSMGPTAILDAYPSGRPKVRQTIAAAQNEDTTRIVTVLSVSSTGTLCRTLLDELQHIALDSQTGSQLDYTLDVIVDRTASGTPPSKSALGDSLGMQSWFTLRRDTPPEPSGSCRLCRHPDKAPLVAVDPMTYREMTLPGPHLVMPNRHHAEAAKRFWERAAQLGGRAIEVNPHPSSRGARSKRAALPVRPLFEVICQPEGLKELVRDQCEAYSLNDCLKRTDLVVTASHDVCEIVLSDQFGARSVDLENSLKKVLAGIGLSLPIPIVRLEREDNSGLTSERSKSELAERIAALDSNSSILLFSWGSVTGLTLRDMKLSVADSLKNAGRDVDVNGLVFHARLSHPREWSAQRNQFLPGNLECLWNSCFPWSSPIVDEMRLLDQSHIRDEQISDSARHFLKCRRQFLEMSATYAAHEDDDWSPRFRLHDDQAHPEHVFWGMSRSEIHQKHVRGRALYGQDLDCLTAYAAIGSAVNFTRFNEQPRAAPRWVMFDMGRIVRSYFDAVITCSVIRWLLPGELWWAERDEPEEIDASVRFLLDQAGDPSEQVLLVPELLLACAQGKVPKRAHEIVRERGKDLQRDWPSDERFNMARGAVEIGLRLLDEHPEGA